MKFEHRHDQGDIVVRINLPMDLLRSFGTIVDTGSMVKASEHVSQPGVIGDR